MVYLESQFLELQDSMAGHGKNVIRGRRINHNHVRTYLTCLLMEASRGIHVIGSTSIYIDLRQFASVFIGLHRIYIGLRRFASIYIDLRRIYVGLCRIYTILDRFTSLYNNLRRFTYQI